MAEKNIICIECPTGCALSVSVQNGKACDVEGAKCPKGEKYAVSEIENPLRTLTSTVSAEGLSLKMVPVRTDKPIPKAKIFEAMREIKKIKVKKPLRIGSIVKENLLGLGTNLVTTRSV